MSQDVNPQHRPSFWAKLPSWAWIIIIIGAFLGAIVLMIGTIFTISTVEGVASLAFIFFGVWVAKLFSNNEPTHYSSLAKAALITFFALMGMALDQIGNPIYNYPVEKICCPKGEYLQSHSYTSSNNGRTSIRTQFRCVESEADDSPTSISTFSVLGIRFLEYVVIGYLLFFLRGFIYRQRFGDKPQKQQNKGLFS